MERLEALGEALTATSDFEVTATTAAEGVDNSPCCAICLGVLDASADTAFIKPCLHPYCVGCILAWASSRATRYPDAPTPCPQCKQSFTSVYVQRTLDGVVSEHLVEESIVLLLRARWTNAAGGATSQEDSDDGSAEFDEEDEEELLARQHRVRLVIGNRRFGGGGFVANGRLLARPLPPNKTNAAAKKPATAEAAPAASSKQTPQRAKREAKAAQALAREAERRARRLGRLLPSAPGAVAGADETEV